MIEFMLYIRIRMCYDTPNKTEGAADMTMILALRCLRTEGSLAQYAAAAADTTRLAAKRAAALALR